MTAVQCIHIEREAIVAQRNLNDVAIGSFRTFVNEKKNMMTVHSGNFIPADAAQALQPCFDVIIFYIQLLEDQVTWTWVSSTAALNS